MGHSMGGMIVQEIANLSGDRINKLIVLLQDLLVTFQEDLNL
jgi:Predicted hydrolases or acyltransferases (alpha/beta hydrolase superfamily)